MHGGKIIFEKRRIAPILPEQIISHTADGKEREEIRKYVEEYCSYFGGDVDEIMKKDFFVLSANSANPYKQLYTSL